MRGPAALAALLAAALLACDRPETGAPAAEAARPPAPEFELPRLDGGSLRLADHLGKTVVIDFWATWCPPCEFQVPELNKLHEAHASSGDVVVVGVAIDVDGAAVVGPWVKEHAVAYPILLGDESLARRFGAQGFPTLAVVDREGRLDSLHVGLIEYATLEEIVSELAAPEPGAG